MSELKYKVGDCVLIKDIGWYNKYKNEDGDVSCGEFLFVEGMKKFCSETLTISEDAGDGYLMLEDCHGYVWTDEMFERLVERNGKTYPYKIGDRVVLKGNNRCATITDLKYNSWGNLSYYIKIDNDKDISIDYPTELLLPYDNMVEDVVEEKTKPKFKVGDKVILDPYPCVVTDVNWRDGLHGFVYTVRGADFGMMVGEEDLIFDISEEETPKFKVNDIVFVKNIGWVRITNGYWDSFANEYIYEVIGFNGEGEYDTISQSNIECQMLPESESENPHTGGNKITLDEYKNNDKEWLFNKLAMLDNITALESIQDIFNHLQQSKYPKTYEECCKILGVDPDNFLSIRNIHRYDGEEETVKYERDLLEKFDSLWVLLICRDAYWKIAGDEMGIGKPWEPDWNDVKQYQYGFYNEVKYTIINPAILVFPTEEMRDVFYENFKEEIEKCKELL